VLEKIGGKNLKFYSKVNIRYPIIETHPYPRDYFIKGDDSSQKF
jgi:hypothetical protein